jgi:membrane dipeptidase
VQLSLHGSGRNGGQQGLPVGQFIDLGVIQYPAALQQSDDAVGKRWRLEGNSMIVNEHIELDAPLIDVHGHTLDLAFKSQRRFHHSLGGLTDLPLMRAGGVAAQLTACWVPDAANGGPHASPDPLRLILQMADYFERELKGAAGDHATLATSASDIEAARDSGKTAFVFGLEGGDCLQGDLSVLRTLHRLGLRHLGLVHEGRNALESATQVWEGSLMRLYDERIDPPGGLSLVGKEVVREMDQLGMLIDLTHMVEASFWDALDLARGPVAATHGNARSLRDTVRYLTDEQIRAVASTGGIVCPSPTPLGPGDEVSSVENVLNHIDYMVDLVGPDYVGFGTDFLGQTDCRPSGFGDISESRNVIKGLMERGHAVEVVSKIMGGNFMRVFRAVAG